MKTFDRILLVWVLVSRCLIAGEPSDWRKDLGTEQGSAMRESAESLRNVDRSVPGEVEVLLYSITERPGYFGDKNANPFGHIALRIGDQVYTANQYAKRGQDAALLMPMNLDQYLYSVRKPAGMKNGLVGSNYGLAYARDNIGVRLSGVTPAALQKMRAEMAAINEEWREGQIAYDWKKYNCADITRRVLIAGGLMKKKWGWPATMPVDVVNEILKALKRSKDLKIGYVGYARVDLSQNRYRHSLFPLTPFQPKRSLSHLVGFQGDWLVKRLDYQLTQLPGEPRLYLKRMKLDSWKTHAPAVKSAATSH